MQWGSEKEHVRLDADGLHLVRDGEVTETVGWRRLRKVELDVPVRPGWRKAGWLGALVATVVSSIDLDGPEGYGEIVTRVYTDLDRETTDHVWIVQADPGRPMTRAEARELTASIEAAVVDPRLRGELVAEQSADGKPTDRGAR